MKSAPESVATAVDPTPRIALFISDEPILTELERTLRKQYSSLMVITERAKLKEFTMPLLIVVDTINEVAEIREAHPVEGTKVLVVTNSIDSESSSAAFDVGADDFLAHPFTDEEVVGKIEKYLSAFRQT